MSGSSSTTKTLLLRSLVADGDDGNAWPTPDCNSRTMAGKSSILVPLASDCISFTVPIHISSNNFINEVKPFPSSSFQFLCFLSRCFSVNSIPQSLQDRDNDSVYFSVFGFCFPLVKYGILNICIFLPLNISIDLSV